MFTKNADLIMHSVFSAVWLMRFKCSIVIVREEIIYKIKVILVSKCYKRPSSLFTLKENIFSIPEVLGY